MHDLNVIISRDLEQDRRAVLKTMPHAQKMFKNMERMIQARKYQIFRESRREVPLEILKTTKF